MSNKYKMADAIKLSGVNKNRINVMIKQQVINPKKNNSGYYVFTDELIELIKMYDGLKRDIKIPYTDIKSLEAFINNTSSKVKCVQKTFEVLRNYDCTANNVATKQFFYICCHSIFGLSDEYEELLNEITDGINLYPHQNETLEAMYDYYLYQAHVIDSVIELSTLELESEKEFWDLDVVKGYEAFIFNIDFNRNRPFITEKIDEFIMCSLMRVKYDTESKSNPLIRKLTLLLKELNKFHDETRIEYDTCQHIFLHATKLLSVDIHDNLEIV
ncbi:MerR family transcriptional regulator [Oceanobacillus sp. FSL K6-2867]|uniref:MerR family transcriptional regulator n=1 Tax=Oceanobacillus sp. FSL K6-2867 TaxID=2954748 RepID=UPI0030DAF69B